jgi:hypothetical protein
MLSRQRTPSRRRGRARELTLLSRGEVAFYRVLRLALPPYLALSLKTRLVDVVGCPDELWTKPYGRRLAQKHVDFVLFHLYTASIVAVLELDDRTHTLPARRRRDRFVSGVLRRAEIPLIRVIAASRYDLGELRRLIASRLPPVS